MTRKQWLIEIGLNGILPWLVFSGLTEHYQWSEYHALLAITIIPSLVALYEFWRERRLDAIAIISLVSILIGLVMTAATSDVRLLQVRESYMTLLIGVVFLFSAMIGRPALYWMAVSQAQRQGTADSLKAAWADPSMRRFFCILTAGWGVTLLAEFAVKIWLIETLTMAQVLAWSPFALYGIMGLAALWTLAYSYRFKKRKIYRMAPHDGYTRITEED